MTDKRTSADVAAVHGSRCVGHRRAGAAWASPRASSRKTPDGQPDLRGTWVNFDSTPFEAPPPAGQSNGAPIPSAPGVNPPSYWADHDSPMKRRAPLDGRRSAGRPRARDEVGRRQARLRSRARRRTHRSASRRRGSAASRAACRPACSRPATTTPTNSSRRRATS